jgi:hypothetical protein
MLKDLPEDQRHLIEERLSPHGALELEKGLRTETKTWPRRGSHVEREMPPLTAYYWRCLREMGPLSKTKSEARIPNPAMAWLQVLNQRDEKSPSFTHHKISETVTYFGGWEQMWFRFNKIQEDRARNQFVMSFKEIVDA